MHGSSFAFLFLFAVTVPHSLLAESPGQAIEGSPKKPPEPDVEGPPTVGEVNGEWTATIFDRNVGCSIPVSCQRYPCHWIVIPDTHSFRAPRRGSIDINKDDAKDVTADNLHAGTYHAKAIARFPGPNDVCTSDVITFSVNQENGRCQIDRGSLEFTFPQTGCVYDKTLLPTSPGENATVLGYLGAIETMFDPPVGETEGTTSEDPGVGNEGDNSANQHGYKNSDVNDL